MEKKELSAAATKNEFIHSIYSWLVRTLKENGREDCIDCFTIEGSSIMCQLPDDYFNIYTIPSGTKIEMKFVTKKS